VSWIRAQSMAPGGCGWLSDSSSTRFLAPFRRILPTFSGIGTSLRSSRIVVIQFRRQILELLVSGVTPDPRCRDLRASSSKLVVDIAIAIAILVFIRVLLGVFHGRPVAPDGCR